MMSIKIGIVSKDQSGAAELIKRMSSWHAWINLDLQKGIIQIANMKGADLEDIIDMISKYFVITSVESSQEV